MAWMLLVPLLILCGLAGVLAFMSAISAQAQLEERGLWITYGILLAISLCPTLWHYQWTVHYAANYTPVASYPGLARFQLVVPVAALMVWALAWIASRRFPWIGTVVPATAFVTYMRALRWVMENPPGVVLDNKPNIALFLLNAAATVGLMTYALAVWGLPVRTLPNDRIS